MDTKTTLAAMAPGQSGRVLGLSATGTLGQRLMDLGFHPGIELRVVRNAPLRDPLEVEMMGGLISLRHREAAHVQVARL